MGSAALTVREIETEIGTGTEMDTGMDIGMETEIATGITTGRGSLYEGIFSNFRLVFCPSSSDQFLTLISYKVESCPSEKMTEYYPVRHFNHFVVRIDLL
mgnify:CR=1 FL=1